MKTLQTLTNSELKALIAGTISFMQNSSRQEQKLQSYSDRVKEMNAARMEIYNRNKAK